MCIMWLWPLWSSLIWYAILFGGVIVSVYTSNVIERGYEPRSGRTKDYNVNMCCFPTKHVALRSKIKDWLALNQNIVSDVERHVYPRNVVSVTQGCKN